MQRRAFVGAGATLAAALALGCSESGDDGDGGGEGGTSSSGGNGSSTGGTSAGSGGTSSSGGTTSGSGGSTASGGTTSGSGGDTSSGGSTASGGNGSGGGANCEEIDVEIETNHPHEMLVPVADLTLTEPKTYTMTGLHTHLVTLTVEDFQTLAAGETVTKTSSSDSGHTHRTTISCA